MKQQDELHGTKGLKIESGKSLKRVSEREKRKNNSNLTKKN